MVFQKKSIGYRCSYKWETCKLPECDFLETRFIEYETYDDFASDGTFTHTEDGKNKGLIICFTRDEKPIYEYAPIGISSEEYDKWEATIMKEHTNDSWIHNIYWKLDEMSCVLVTRNTEWFNAVIYQMQDLWNIVLNERVSGYEHRAPKKRIKTRIPKLQALL